MSRMSFELLATDGKARRGRLTFPRGTVETPAFMPVGTYGTVKGMLPRDIVATGAEIILGNTYHLYLRPGDELVGRAAHVVVGLGHLEELVRLDGGGRLDDGHPVDRHEACLDELRGLRARTGEPARGDGGVQTLCHAWRSRGPDSSRRARSSWSAA